MSGVALVQFSKLDTPKLLVLGRQMFERSLSEKADSIDSNPPLHDMLCIASMNEPDLKPSAAACVPYMNLFHAGFCIVADERDIAEILAICGMPSVMVETVSRGICSVFVAGTLLQWKSALLRGCVKSASRETRHTFNLVYGEFNKMGLAPLFEARKVEQFDHTFLLEYHP
jgi:hypothetical protein